MLYVLLTGTKPFCSPEAEAAGEDAARLLMRIIDPWCVAVCGGCAVC